MLQGHYTVTSIGPQATAHLAQTMTLLNMNSEELLQHLESELAANPALELESERRCPNCHRILRPAEICPVCSQRKQEADGEPVVFLSPMRDLYHDRSGSRIQQDGDEDFEDDFRVQEENLATYLLKQVSGDLNGVEHQIAEHLANNLDENGFLTISLFEISRYFHVPVTAVERVKSLLQRCEPLGVASVNSTEAMRIQLEMLADVMEIPPLVNLVLADGMEFLFQRRIADLCERFDMDDEDLQEVIRFIGNNLNPFPAHSHYGSSRQPVSANVNVYHHPDVIFHFLNDDPDAGLAVEVMMPYVYRPFLNRQFKEAMNNAPEEQKEEWQKDHDRASLLVKCLQQRAFTMLRLMQFLAKNQDDFILHGDKYLKPITRASVAELLEVHESTISRAVANKTAQLPNGRIIPLSSFFSRNLNVRTVLKELVDHEEKPLSDSMLVKELEKFGYSVARRTVAKYRSMEGILPAHLRKASRKYHGNSNAQFQPSQN
ncbi:MAG: hypothetical protein HPY85_05055 [Anaerolineae bacterium]|nr:hypothetical protein [Anaerolineae bacterium]